MDTDLHVRFEPEEGGFERIICEDCDQQIGRVTAASEAAGVAKDEIAAEVRLMIEEHRSIHHAHQPL